MGREGDNMKRMRQYYIDENGTRKCFVRVMTETDKKHCDICNAIADFLAIPESGHEIPINMKGLATGNLKRHLATGKHWMLVNEYSKKV